MSDATIRDIQGATGGEVIAAGGMILRDDGIGMDADNIAISDAPLAFLWRMGLGRMVSR